MVGDAVRKVMRGEVGQDLVDHHLGEDTGEFGTEGLSDFYVESLLKEAKVQAGRNPEVSAVIQVRDDISKD